MHGSDRVKVRDAGSAVVLEVRNQGTPIPELMPVIFEPFGTGSDGDRRGLGLGLFIVQQIIRAHGGTVDASSSLEHGTLFRATFPRAPE